MHHLGSYKCCLDAHCSSTPQQLLLPCSPLSPVHRQEGCGALATALPCWPSVSDVAAARSSRMARPRPPPPASSLYPALSFRQQHTHSPFLSYTGTLPEPCHRSPASVPVEELTDHASAMPVAHNCAQSSPAPPQLNPSNLHARRRLTASLGEPSGRPCFFLFFLSRGRRRQI